MISQSLACFLIVIAVLASSGIAALVGTCLAMYQVRTGTLEAAAIRSGFFVFSYSTQILAAMGLIAELVAIYTLE